MSMSIVNSFGDPFDPPLEEEVRLITLKLGKSFSLLDWSNKRPDLLDNTVNGEDITIVGQVIPAGFGLLFVDASREMYVSPGGVVKFYMKASFDITIDTRWNWAHHVLDFGMKARNATTGTVETARSPGMADHRHPRGAKLDGEGHWLPVTTPPTDPVYCHFWTVLGSSWGVVGFPEHIDGGTQ
jgi:hypothetical protein